MGAPRLFEPGHISLSFIEERNPLPGDGCPESMPGATGSLQLINRGRSNSHVQSVSISEAHRIGHARKRSFGLACGGRIHHNDGQIDVAGGTHFAAHRAAEEVRGGNHRGLLLDFGCDETSEFSKKLPLPFKEGLQLFDERVPAVEFESVTPWGSPSQDDALIDE
jgi:hypothetical protein